MFDNHAKGVYITNSGRIAYHPQLVAAYHPSGNEYISLSGEYIIKPQEDAR